MDKNSLIDPNARGFAGLIKSIMEPLNENLEFKENFKKLDRKFLINASNLEHAALISVNQGVLKVESVLNKPESNLKKKLIGWDGYISMDSQIFLALAMNRISIIGIGLKWILGKVKMRGIFKLLALLSIFEFLKK
ncbi:MAG: hypothetical protein MUP85_01930 [Candidatus Lokiarchaeota archaeon]|nr:hypothetical protein [Candidatus Lokiarchaeota archaeon]